MQFFLNQHANVVVFPATPHVDLVYRVSKALLAPSLWPEAFGLVALEASLRGIPAITSDSAGLREANPAAQHVVETPLVFDVNEQKLLRNASQDGALRGAPGGHNDAALDRGRTPGFNSMIGFFAKQFKMSEADVKGLLAVADGSEIDGYSAHVDALGDPARLKAASDVAYSAARKYVADRRDLFIDRLVDDARARRGDQAPPAPPTPPPPPPPVAAAPAPPKSPPSESPPEASGGARRGSFRAFLAERRQAQAS